VAAVLTVVGVFVAWGLLAPPRVRPGTGRVPRPPIVGVGTFVVGSVFVARPETMPGVLFGVCLGVVAWILLRRWSQAPGWGAWHGYALVAGSLPIYAWLGFVLTLLLEPDDGVPWAGNAVFAVAAGVLLLVLARAVRRNVPAPVGVERRVTRTI
jgi:hypothetical protein